MRPWFFIFLFFIGWAASGVINKPQIHGVVVSEQLQSPEKTFNWLDSDGTGTISFDEYMKSDLNYVEAIQNEFKKIDLDGM